MAVMIEELEVEVTETPEPARTPANAAPPRGDKVDLARALERLRERQARLRAD